MKCLIQSEHEDFVQSLAAALVREGISEGDLAFCAARDVMACISEFAPKIVLIDIVNDVPPSTDLLKDMTRRIEGARIVLVGPPKDAGYTVAAVKQGVRDFLGYPVDSKELRSILEQAGAELDRVESKPSEPDARPARPSEGKIVTVCAPKGGMGVTLLTANLGAMIARRQSVTAVATELASQCGDLGTYLNLGPHYTIMDLIRQSASLDDSFVRGVIQKHASGLDVLSGPVYAQDQLDPSQLKELHFIFGHLKRKYDLVLVDAAGAHAGILEFALMQSDMILIVGSLDIPSLKGLSAMYRRLIRLMYDPAKIHIVINRYNAKHQIGVREFEKKIEHPVDACLINQYALCIESVNTGKTLFELDPGSELVKNLASLGGSVLERLGIESRAGEAAAAEKPGSPKLVGKLAGMILKKGVEMIPIRKLTPGSAAGPAQGDASASVPPAAPKKIEPARIEARKTGDRFQAFCDLKTSLHKNLIDQVDLDVLVKLDQEVARRQIEAILGELLSQQNKMPLTQAERVKVIQEVVHETFGLGPLEPLLEDPQVDEILVNRCDTVYVERGGKLFRTGVRFKDDTHLRHVITRIASRVGRRIDEASPMVDARLADGSRVNAVIPPLALDGCCLSIRKFRENPLTLEELMELGTFSSELVELIRVAVAAKCNILISGGTGSGKTTLLNVMSQFLSHEERIITIEDAAEIRLRQPHVVRLETRPANVEGKGSVSARDLVRNALRMRPDRIIVGEVRGPEAMDMLQAMNTGHDGSMTTVHANSPRDALTRIETMVLLAAGNLDQRSINRQIASAIDLVVQIRRYPDGRRRVDSVAEVTGMEGATICIQELASFDGEAAKDGSVTGAFRVHRTTPKFFAKAAELGVELPSWMKRLAERPQARGPLDPSGGTGL